MTYFEDDSELWEALVENLSTNSIRFVATAENYQSKTQHSENEKVLESILHRNLNEEPKYELVETLELTCFKNSKGELNREEHLGRLFAVLLLLSYHKANVPGVEFPELYLITAFDSANFLDNDWVSLLEKHLEGVLEECDLHDIDKINYLLCLVLTELHKDKPDEDIFNSKTKAINKLLQTNSQVFSNACVLREVITEKKIYKDLWQVYFDKYELLKYL